MKDNTKYEYLAGNSKFSIERSLLNSLDEEELKVFVKDLYEEYKKLDTSLNEEYESVLSQYKGMNEISQYFVELIIFKYSDVGIQHNKLKKTLEGIDFHLKKEEIQESSWGSFPEIDIHTIPIRDVIGRYTQLPSSRRQHIVCPIHKEKTPSLKIYDQTNSWHCFGCRRGGNAINFIAYMENCTTKEAFKIFVHLYFN